MKDRNTQLPSSLGAGESWVCRGSICVRVAGFLLLFGYLGTATPAFINLPRNRSPQTGGAVAFRSQASLFRTDLVPRRFPRALDRRFRHGSVLIRGTRGVLTGGRRRETADSRLETTVAAAAATTTSMTMDDADAPKIIDGKATAGEIRKELKARIEATKLSESGEGLAPGLAVVLVGDRRDSATYVRMKKKACEEVGIKSFGFDFPEDVTQDDLIACVEDLNSREDVHGILVQLPLPKHIDEKRVLHAITPNKDVDGLHPSNVAALCAGRTRAGGGESWSPEDLDFHVPCTPQGCIELLDRYGVKIPGKRAVVLGRSNIVGIPVSMLLMHRDATVTVAHSKTVDVASVHLKSTYKKTAFKNAFPGG